jgi:DNA-directed RNA polymerase subunit K/omega
MSDSEADDYNSDGGAHSDEDVSGGAKKKIPKVAIVQKKTMDYDDEDDSEPDDEDDDEDEDDDFVPNDVDENDKKKIAGVEVDSDADEYEIEDDDEDEDEDDETEKPKKKAAAIKVPVVPQVVGSDDEDEYDEEDENYLQKFEIDVNRNYIHEFHPECISHNYERARVLGQRAKQIETGSKPLVKVPENIIDGYLIAEIELEQKKIPFIIRRPIPNGGSEYWRLNDLQIIAF